MVATQTRQSRREQRGIPGTSRSGATTSGGRREPQKIAEVLATELRRSARPILDSHYGTTEVMPFPNAPPVKSQLVP